jgi:prepilin-type N-terminal cleavage/methylation domain-containing protein
MKKNDSHSGFTLVELMITIALFTIIVSIAVGGFTNALRTQRQVSSLIATQSNVSLALEQITREMRTGYLFCHDQDIDGALPNNGCGCIISGSGFIPPIAPATPSEEYTDGSLPTWTCSSIDYYTADGTHVSYSRDSNGELIRSVISPSGTTESESITGTNVNVETLSFVLFGNIEGDNWTPRITIAIGVAPSSTDAATENDVLNLQTTVSAREIDCNSDSGSLQC